MKKEKENETLMTRHYKLKKNFFKKTSNVKIYEKERNHD